jgi:hypothetical protein
MREALATSTVATVVIELIFSGALGLRGLLLLACSSQHIGWGVTGRTEGTYTYPCAGLRQLFSVKGQILNVFSKYFPL